MLTAVRSAWAEPRSPHPPPPGRRDGALVGALIPAAALEGLLRPDLPWRWVSVLLLIALVSILPWRRTAPLATVAGGFGVLAVAGLLTSSNVPDLNTAACLLLLPYAVFRWGSGREAAAGTAIMVTKIALTLPADDFTLSDAAAGCVVVFAVAVSGVAVRYQSAARGREVEQIKLLERERLARDLHDTVAHHVSAIAILAQAGLAQAEQAQAEQAQVGTDATIDALRLIEAEASRTLAEMRSMVHVLRRDRQSDLTPYPRLADLELLAVQPGSPAVRVQIDGDVDDLPPPVTAGLYRLAQESVTNARRHARRATRIEIRVVADTTNVHLVVDDDGEPVWLRSGSSAGYGLIGMRERADLLGGNCLAGPGAERGWTVTAVLPRTGVPS